MAAVTCKTETPGAGYVRVEEMTQKKLHKLHNSSGSAASWQREAVLLSFTHCAAHF